MSAADDPQTSGTPRSLAGGATIEHLCHYDFMRCGKCGRLITHLEMVRAIGPKGTGKACPCGALKYAPSNLVWYDWLKPRVLYFACQRLRGVA